MPNLASVYLPNAFLYKYDDVTVRGSTHFTSPSQLVIGDLYPFFRIQTAEMYEYCLNILEGSDEITDLVVGNYVCPFENVTAFDLSVYPRLETLRIGNESFVYVSEFNITGFSELQSVVIGKKSFTKSNYGNDPNRHFYLKSCPKMRELKIGSGSFSDYSMIEVEDVDALEVIVIGDLNEWSYNFHSAPLELKSILSHKE